MPTYDVATLLRARLAALEAPGEVLEHLVRRRANRSTPPLPVQVTDTGDPDRDRKGSFYQLQVHRADLPRLGMGSKDEAVRFGSGTATILLGVPKNVGDGLWHQIATGIWQDLDEDEESTPAGWRVYWHVSLGDPIEDGNFWQGPITVNWETMT